MKNIILSFLLLFLAPESKQIVYYSKIDSSDLIHLLNNINILSEFRSTKMHIRVLELRNEPGSAGNANGEATSDIFIAVSEFGEYPEQNVFKLSPLYGPFVEKVDSTGNIPMIYLSYVPDSARATLTIKCSLSKLEIK